MQRNFGLLKARGVVEARGSKAPELVSRIIDIAWSTYDAFMHWVSYHWLHRWVNAHWFFQKRGRIDWQARLVLKPRWSFLLGGITRTLTCIPPQELESNVFIPWPTGKWAGDVKVDWFLWTTNRVETYNAVSLPHKSWARHTAYEDGVSWLMNWFSRRTRST